jgi:diguanylate cyclase (GGDEF)-like protein
MEPMFNMAPEDLPAVLLELDNAIYNHEQWHRSILRTLICRIQHDQRDTAEDAHRQCLFGQWYYGRARPDLHSLAAFVAVESAHKFMHQQGAGLLRLTEAGEQVSPRDHDRFANAVDSMRLEILTLRHELEDSLYNRDPLTGAYGRVGLLTKLREQHDLVKRRVQTCSIAMMDLDHFKAVNDTYGHQAGDRALVTAARYLINNIRPYDRVFRYGGEEFLIVLQQAEPGVALGLVERLREGIAAAPVEWKGGEPIRVTASFGIAALDPESPVESAIDRADKAMYAAKQSGRNCTRLWDPSL